LRFPFDPDFIARVQGQTLTELSRRAKFLQAELSSGDRLFMHLGMSGRFTIDNDMSGDLGHRHVTNPKHDHVVFFMSSGHRILAPNLWQMHLTGLSYGRRLRARKVKLKPHCWIKGSWQDWEIFMCAKPCFAAIFPRAGFRQA